MTKYATSLEIFIEAADKLIMLYTPAPACSTTPYSLCGARYCFINNPEGT